MSAWRDVEVAAAEALDGPDARTTSRRSAPRLHRRGRQGARAGHGPRRGRLRRRAGRLGRTRRRWIHYGLTSSDVLDTALALQLRRAGEIVVPGARALAAALAERAREHAGHPVRRAHARRPCRADLLRPQAGRLRLRGAPQRRAARARVRPGGDGRDLRRGRDLRVARARTTRPRARRPRPARPSPSRPRSCRATGTRSSSRRSRSPAPGSSASPRRSGISSARRCARSRSPSARARRARARCRTSATRSSRSASPASRALLRGYAQAAVEDVALWHERDISHSGAERVLLPDATIVLDYAQHLALRVVRGMTVHADRMRANLELTCGALFSQRVLLALVDGGMGATTPTGSCSGWRRRRGTPRRRCVRCSSASPASISTSTRSSTTATTRATCPRCWRGWRYPCP